MINIKKAAICAVLFMLIFNIAGCSAKSIIVSGNSMVPTIENGDKLILSELVGNLKHNDIAVIDIEIPANEIINDKNMIIVTRIIGLPGDEIDIDFENGLIIRNNSFLLHEIIDGGLYEDGHRINAPTNNSYDMDDGIFTVPENKLFVLGDNRNSSFLDSRSDLVGFVDIDNVIGIIQLQEE